MLLLKISGRVTLLGDHKQLVPVLQSRKAQSIGFNLSLFERLYNMHVPYTLLDTQYRMNPYIGDLVSSLCYDDQLKNGVTTDQRTLPLADNYPTKVSNNPVAFVNCFASEQYDRSMHSVTNQQEANCVVDAVVKLIGDQKISGRQIAVITSYNAQLKLIKCLVDERLAKVTDFVRVELLKVRIGTVDSFQGQESDVVLYSIVRSNNQLNIGFLDQYRRLNVAISRTKSLLLIFGNATMFPSIVVLERLASSQDNTLYGRSYWYRLVQWCIKHNVIFNQAGEQITLPNENRWPSIGDSLKGVVRQNDTNSQDDNDLMFEIISEPKRLVVSVRDDVVQNLRSKEGEAHRDLKRQYGIVRIYVPPLVTSVGGWTEVVLIKLDKEFHSAAYNYIYDILQRHNKGRSEMRRCFNFPTYNTRGENCRIKKSQIFYDDLALDLPDFHYRDTKFVLSNGVTVLFKHPVRMHIHVRHNVHMALVGILQTPPYELNVKLKKHNLIFLSKAYDKTHKFEFYCVQITAMKNYRPGMDHWTMDEAYDYITRSIEQLFRKWASEPGTLKKKARYNSTAQTAIDRGIDVPLNIFQ